MLELIKKLILVFKYGTEIETFLIKIREEAEKRERIAKKDNLKLCLGHKQEETHSHYSEHNCDYCKLKKELETTKNRLISQAFEEGHIRDSFSVSLSKSQEGD